MMRFDYDLIVIGGGAAGLTAAGMSALLGAKTALIEQHRLGGDCTWVGCIPSKTLLHAAKTAHVIRTAARIGLAADQPSIDCAKVMQHVRQVRQQVYDDADAPPNIESLGVEFIPASARFCDSHSIELHNSTSVARRLTSRFFVIATGSRPKTPAFSEPTLNNETVFDLQQLPQRLVIMGAGPIGIEMAQAFRRLGSHVTVIANRNCILPRDDPDHSRLLHQYLSQEGISFFFEQKVARLERNLDQLACVLDSSRTVVCDAVLSAIGRAPATDHLQLEKAMVRFDARGIQINRHCRTTQRYIYAVGDVTGRYQFTHMAEHMAKVAVTNAILGLPQTIDHSHVIWSTFTDPELAHLGQSEQQLHRRSVKFAAYRFPFRKLDRAITETATAGEIKVLADRRGRILGVSILGAQAGEMISEYALAMRHGLRLSQIADTIHPYPTYMLGNRRAADQFVAQQLDHPLLALLGKLRGYRGHRRGSRALAGP